MPRRFSAVLTLTASLLLPVLWAVPAAAESGAHRKPVAPPVDTPVVIAERD